MKSAGFNHEPCDAPFELVERVTNFATIPALRERIRCSKCTLTFDLYRWHPPIRERNNTAIIINPEVLARPTNPEVVA